MSVSILIVVPALPSPEDVGAAATAVSLVAERRGGGPGSYAFRGPGSSHAVEVELVEDEAGQRAIAVRTASGRSAIDSWRQARLALELLERNGGALAPGEKLTLDQLRTLAGAAPPGVRTDQTWLRRHLRPLGAAGAFLFATAGLVTLIATGGIGSRYALVLFVMAALSTLLAVAERRGERR